MYLTKKHLYDEQRIPIASLIDSCTETRSDIVYNYGVLVMFGKTVSFIRPAYFDHSYPQKIEYTHEQTVPEGESEKFEWLKGMNITVDTTDEEIMAASRGYAVRFAKVAAKFRKELIARYGTERGSKIRYAEAYELCEYGRQPDEALKNALFPL